MTGTMHEPCSITVFRTFSQDTLFARVRGAYREMPGMRLTLDQAMRMWSLDRQTCSHVLSSLVAAHFLEQDHTGRYMKTPAGY